MLKIIPVLGRDSTGPIVMMTPLDAQVESGIISQRVRLDSDLVLPLIECSIWMAVEVLHVNEQQGRLVCFDGRLPEVLLRLEGSLYVPVIPVRFPSWLAAFLNSTQEERLFGCLEHAAQHESLF